MNLSVVILPAKVLADGMHKVRIAISHNSQTRYKVTRFKVPSPRNVRNGRVTGKDIGNAEYINQQLNSLVQRMYEAYDEIPDAECYTCSQLLELIEARLAANVPKTFDEVAAEWLAMKRKRCADSSMLIYEIAVRSFSDFMRDGFLLSMLTPQIVSSYDEHLAAIGARYKNTKRRLSPTTINIRLRVLRSIVRFAQNRRFVSYLIDPFLDYKERTERIRDAFLPVSALRSIRDFASSDENANIARDIFMLSFYLCGMNLEDLLTLDFSKNDVVFVRGKTRSRRLDTMKTTFTIQPEARAIIDRYIQGDGRLRFAGRRKKSVLSTYFERHFPKIEQFIGSDKHIIFYSARKTFSQLANMLKIQEMVIRYCIGDALSRREKDMLVYYTRTEKRMADEAIRLVLDFVASDRDENDLFA